jgi:hypothetical protein
MADSPVTAALSLGDQAALIPDLERLESRLTQA